MSSESSNQRRRHRVASTSELGEPGSRVISDLDGHEIAVINVRGELYAVANYCVHQGGPLCEGPLTGRMVGGDDGWAWRYVDEGKIVTCPWHSWKFDLSTGRNVKDDRYRVPTYDVEIEGDSVYVRR